MQPTAEEIARMNRPPPRKLGDEEANSQRLIAAQIIWNLWHSGQREQLRMLEIQARSSREDIEKNNPHLAKQAARDNREAHAFAKRAARR